MSTDPVNAFAAAYFGGRNQMLEQQQAAQMNAFRQQQMDMSRQQMANENALQPLRMQAMQADLAQTQASTAAIRQRAQYEAQQIAQQASAEQLAQIEAQTRASHQRLIPIFESGDRAAFDAAAQQLGVNATFDSFPQDLVEDEATFEVWGKYREMNAAPKGPEPTASMREYEFAKGQGYQGTFQDWETQNRKAGATTVNMGGGSDKQIFDEMKASADAARSAATGLASLQQAKSALESGAITGFAADQRLYLQKLGTALGITDPAAVQNTETFRAAIAPQVAALMKATVGSTQISNADREFAEKAAGGSITLDEGSIRRLVGIMEKAGNEVIAGHTARLNAVYPDGGDYGRERALFGVSAPQPVAPATGGTLDFDAMSPEELDAWLKANDPEYGK